MQPNSKWKPLDFRLAQAFQIYEDELSGETGLPMWLTNSTDPSVQFMVMELTDRAGEALGKWDHDKKNISRREKNPGLRRYVVPFTEDGESVEYGGLKRHQYRMAANQEEQDLADGINIERDRPEGGYNPADYGDGVTGPA